MSLSPYSVWQALIQLALKSYLKGLLYHSVSSSEVWVASMLQSAIKSWSMLTLETKFTLALWNEFISGSKKTGRAVNGWIYKMYVMRLLFKQNALHTLHGMLIGSEANAQTRKVENVFKINLVNKDSVDCYI